VKNLAIKDQQTNGDAEKEESAVEVEAPEEIAQKKREPESERYTREIATLEKELELEQRKSTDLSNRMRYLQADIVNLQRQSDRKVSEVRNQVKLTWILEILSIKEDLDRAIGVAREAREKSSLLDGLLLVTSRIENILKLESVEIIKAEIGGRFDPSVHEALAFQDSETEEHGTILAVISPGYSVDGKVIKPSMVEVSRRKERKESADRNDLGGDRLSKELEIEEPTQHQKKA
jgi:molecular chaperone GrpE